MEKLYIFTKEVKKWGVEAGDYFNPKYHQIVGGAEKLLKAGIIEPEEENIRIMDISNGDEVRGNWTSREEAEQWIEEQDNPYIYQIMEEK